jgi:hypothetical protein
MIDPQDYLNRDNWLGAYYELAIEYYPKGNDEQLLKALRTMWNMPIFSGPWNERADFQGPVEIPASLDFDYPPTLYGVITLPGNRDIGCLTVIVRESADDASDWLDLCIPEGMLELVYPVKYPLLRKDNPYLDEVDRVLLEVAEATYRVSPFNLALMGGEASGLFYEKTISAEWLTPGGFIIPPSLFERLNADLKPEVLSTGLRWLPWTI